MFILYNSEDAVCIGKVRCTFWSLGESLKPGAIVNPFVISAFCYTLFIKPSGRPDISKSHYFFANIGVSTFMFISWLFTLIFLPFIWLTLLFRLIL